jgi:hypothetical protein
MQPALATPSRDLSAPAVRAFVKIATIWQMDLAEQRAALGGVSRQTIYNWREHPERARLSDDQLDRILFTRPEQADSWIRRANSSVPFGGRPAADLLFSGRMLDLIRVRRHLDGARGAW